MMFEGLIAETARYCGTMDPVITFVGTGLTDTNALSHYLHRLLQITKKLSKNVHDERRMQEEAIRKESSTGVEVSLLLLYPSQRVRQSDLGRERQHPGHHGL